MSDLVIKCGCGATLTVDKSTLSVRREGGEDLVEVRAKLQEMNRLCEFHERTEDALLAKLQEAERDAARCREALRNLLWAATERDKKNRIRQFDEFVDNARAAIDAAIEKSKD